MVLQTGFLFSIAGLSFTLVGFSGLIAALGRDGQRPALLVYRIRQIPEMALASALIALITLPLLDTTGSTATTVRIGAAVAFVFTLGHAMLLLRRTRVQPLGLGPSTWVAAPLIDITLLSVAIVAVVTATVGAYEWLLVLLVTRAGVAFVLALGDIIRA